MPTARRSRIATCWATLSAKLVLPMPGRPAMMIRLPRFRPCVMRSKSMKPLGTPVSMEPGRSSSSSSVLWSTVPRIVKPRWIDSSPSPRIDCSARPSASCAWSPPSMQSRMIWPEAWISRRRTERSLTISA